MKPLRNLLTRHKAASAALAIISLAALPARGSDPQPTLPPSGGPGPLPTQAFRFGLPQTPELLLRQLADFPASALTDAERLMLADWYFYQGDYPRALELYNDLRTDAFSGDIRSAMLYRKAYSLLKTGYYEEAAPLFLSLATDADFGADARFYAAYIDYVGGRYDDAYRGFLNVRNTASRGFEADYYLTQIDYLRGDYRKVAVDAERLISSPDVPPQLLPESLRVAALSRFKLGDKAAARPLLTRYVETQGDGAEISALYALATILYDEGEYDRALPLLSTVTEYPGDLAQSAWLYIGQISMARGDAQGAALAFDKAARESWDSDVAQTAAYNLAVTSADGLSLPFADATAAMEKFVDDYPHSPYAPVLSRYLTNAYYGQRAYEKALRQVEKLDSREPATKASRQKILYQLGGQQLRRGEARAAAASLKEAAGGPDLSIAAQSRLWLGDALYAQKDFKGAAKEYQAAIDSRSLGENEALATYNLGYALLKTKNYRKAEQAFKRALEMTGLTSRQTVDARLRYADCLYYNGRHAEAIAIFDDIKQQGGEEAEFAASREADIYPEMVVGMLRTAPDDATLAEYAAKAMEIPGYEAQGAVILGETLLRLGQPDKAEEVLLKLIDEGSDENYWLARAYIALSDAYATRGKDYLARLYLESLQTNYPGNETDIIEMIQSRLNNLNQ